MRIKSVLRASAITLVATIGAGAVMQASGCYSSSAGQFSAAKLPQRTIAQTEIAKTIPALHVSIPKPPQTWTAGKLTQTAMYSQQEWYGPSQHTGLGVVYVHMPIPMPTSTLVWLAKDQYTKRQDGGKMINQWVDPAGRNWFEAVSKTYHAIGYVIADGSNAWIAYCGYRTHFEKQNHEVAIAEQAMNAMRPITNAH